jgi:hypothetical protein
VVSAVAGLTLWAAFATAGAVQPSPAPARGAEAARNVLRGEKFPWYDAKAERVVPLLPWPDLHFQWLTDLGNWLKHRLQALGRWFRWLNQWRIPWVNFGAGDLVAVGLALLFLTLVLVFLLEMFRRYRPVLDEAAGARGAAIRAGTARRIEGLPAGVGLDLSDPWSEAQRLRALGDYANAVIYLFAHQLLALERVKQVRLVPGRTGRQLVRAVADRELRRRVEPTLRLFEAVYYGHRAPSAEAFEAVWALAQEFEGLLAAGAAP